MEYRDTASERAVIEALLADSECYESLTIDAGDFQDTDCRAAFGAFATLIGSGKKPDLPMLGIEMPGKVSFLAGLNPMTSGNVGYYAGRIRDCSRRRGIVSIMHRVKDALEGPVEITLEEIEKGLVELQDGDGNDLRMLRDVLDPALKMIEDRYRLHGKPPGISTGFFRIDAPLGGLQNGNLVIIGARPSIGKTALALSMTLNIAKAGGRVGFFSCEMTAEQLVIRALSSVGRVNSQSLSSGYLTQDDFSRIVDAGEPLMRAQVIIDDTPNITLTLLKNRARRMKRLGAAVIFVDYLTLIRHGDARMPRWERVGEISKNLKQLARELNIPVVAMSQVGRDADDRMPTLSDLRQSGEIEEDADVILLLHRDRKKAEDDQDYTTQVDIAKNRHGATQLVELVFMPKFVSFEEKMEVRT